VCSGVFRILALDLVLAMTLLLRSRRPRAAVMDRFPTLGGPGGRVEAETAMRVSPALAGQVRALSGTPS
jgi:hypothetical protein